MPVDIKILNAFGSTKERLREMLIAVASPDPSNPPANETAEESKLRLQKKLDCDNRTRFQNRLRSRIFSMGINNTLQNWRPYAAVDMAWDTYIITRAIIPLLMYAQGKISVQTAAKTLSKSPVYNKYLHESVDAKGAKQVELDIPRFVDCEVNLVRSVITRRHGAQKVKYSELWPFYKYESRSTGLVGKLRADVVSQRMDIMADQFGHREHEADVYRDGLLYGHSVDFKRCRWEVDRQWEKLSFEGLDNEVKEVITREGFSWFNPHPTRVYSDLNGSLTSLNSDTGAKWVGYFDIVPWSDVYDNPAYFNNRSVGWTNTSIGVFTTYLDFFNNYNFIINPPPIDGAEVRVAEANDRLANMGYYASNTMDSSVFLVNHYEKFIPKDWGVGTYPFEVWTRFVVAADSTVVYAEFDCDVPAAVLSVNESNSRLINVSMAMELIGFQQQMTNMLTHFLVLLQLSSFKAIGINTDGVTPEEATAIRNALGSENWYKDPLVYRYSLAKLAEAGIKEPKDIISVSGANIGQALDMAFQNIVRFAAFVDRQMSISPAEIGQPATHEISATESNNIQNTTTSVYDAIGVDIDSYRAAKKRIQYNSLLAFGEGDVRCPVKERYTKATVEAAGFQVVPGEDEDTKALSKRVTVIGSPRLLNHDYIFTTRDGSSRPVNTQAANTLVQLIAQVMSVPTVAQKLGRAKLYSMFNEVFRLSGAGVDLNLELEEGEDDSLGMDDIEQLKQLSQQLLQSMQQLAQQTQKNSQDIAQQTQVNEHQEQLLDGVQQLAEQVKKGEERNQQQEGKVNDINKRLVESISYRDAPPVIRAQMELQAGFVPATDKQREEPDAAA